MSQPRVRKILSNGAEMPRARTSTTKASGDSIGCPIRPHQDIPSKSKNKIPKSVRYELDNALVSLCDVWFEEIKPYLERNNIKLHVSGDHECAPPTTPVPPPSLRAPGCSHLDPGAASDQLRRVASCVGSSSTPPIVSSARCAKLRTPSRRPLSPLLSVPQTPRDCPQTLPLNCEEKKQERRCIRRKHRRFKPQPQPNWRVPRLCRTYTVLCRVGSGTASPTPVSASHRPPQPPRDNYYHFIMPRRESVMKNKATQTEKALYVSRGCQSYNATCSLAPRSPKRSPNSNFDRISPTCNAVSVRSDFATSQKNLPPSIICQLKRPEESVAEAPPLLQDDLIDIIAEGNERRLKLLYSSSDKDNHPSFMNLVPNSHQRKRVQKKHPPWR